MREVTFLSRSLQLWCLPCWFQCHTITNKNHHEELHQQLFFFPLTYARNPVQNCPHIAVDGKIPKNMPARYHYRSLESHCVLSTILWGKLLHPKLCVEIIHRQTNYCANDKNTAWREGLCLCPLQPSCKCLEHKETAILTGSIHIKPSPLFYRHISNSVISKNKDWSLPSILKRQLCSDWQDWDLLSTY